MPKSKVKSAVKKKVIPTIKTAKVYEAIVKTNEPIPNMGGTTIEKDVGYVSYDELTDTATASCSDQKYEVYFPTFRNMAYISNDEPPRSFARGDDGRAWVLNMHKATNMVVSDIRRIKFHASEAVVVSEEPIIE
tara:strand:- start:312 stop:713 length:402 start_codon:yes stop_codon:yes gene_type:complete